MKCYLCDNEQLRQISTELRQGSGSVLYCETCDLAMLANYDAEREKLQNFYLEDYRKTHGPRVNKPADYPEIFESYVNYQEQRVDLLRPYLNSSTRVLEVGCSTGHFLYNIKDQVQEVVGVDYDAKAAEFAAQKCQCTTFGCALEDSGLPPASFDLAGAIHTMEHVEDPVRFVGNLGRYLKADGTIFIEVPSLHDPLLRIYDAPQYRNFWFQDVHLFYFSPKSLKAVMQKAGFHGEVYFTQDYNVLNHLHWLMLGTPQANCHAGLSAPTFPLSEQTGPELRQELDRLLATFDREYKQILERHGVSGNITFIGTRS